MKTFEVKITKEVYTKDFGWVVKNESLIIEAENKEDAYFEASAKGTVLFVKQWLTKQSANDIIKIVKRKQPNEGGTKQ